MHLPISLKISVRLAPGMGRGVFADEDIKIGTVIDVNATWVLNGDDMRALSQSSMSGFWFAVPDNPKEALLALGTISLLNHSRQPNAKLTWIKLGIGWIGSVAAIENIARNSQIFVDYGLPDDDLPFMRNHGILAGAVDFS